MRSRILLAVAAIGAIAAVSAPAAFANHSWGKYHWARTASNGSFTLDLARNTTSPWTTMLTTASSNWNASTGPSTVLHTNVVAGDDSDRKACPPVLGRVEVCNADYGNSGWLGLAQIWIYRGGSHIAQGVTELNDYYFSGAGKSYTYNNSAEQQHVVCQEVGHTFGLDHQDESGISLDTCMDYYHNTSSTDTRSTKPNAGDFGELSCIYDPAFKRRLVSSLVSTTYANYTHTCRGTGHLDSFDSAGAAAAFSPFASPMRTSKFVARLAGGARMVTFVTWAGF
jgi:hypothetical protein